MQGNPPRMRIWNHWWYRQNLLLLTPISQTDAEVQRKLLREHDQKFAELPDQPKLTKLYSNNGFSKNIDKGQFLHYTWRRRTWWDENIMSRVHLTSKWGNIPRERVEDRPSPGCECLWSSRTLEIMIESSFRDKTVSWVRIVDGINKYVTETSEEIVLRTEVQGNLSRRLNHDQSRL